MRMWKIDIPSKMLSKGAVYALGVFLFGLSYETLKSSIDGIGLVLASLFYLLLLRFVAEKVGK